MGIYTLGLNRVVFVVRNSSFSVATEATYRDDTLVFDSSVTTTVMDPFGRQAAGKTGSGHRDPSCEGLSMAIPRIWSIKRLFE